MPRRPDRAPALPPAGHTRDELLRRRSDDLEAQAAEQFANSGAIDPAKLKIDREAAYIHERTDGYEVKNAVPGYIYCWVREDKPGNQVQWARSKRVKMPDGDWAALWEVVQGDMPECPDERDVRGYRKIIDCILMRARAERYRQYQIQQEEIKQLREHGTSEGLQDLADKSRGLVKVYSDVEMTAQKTTLDRAQQAGFARQAFTQKLRTGTAHQI